MAVLLGEEQRWKVSENKFLRRNFGPRGDNWGMDNLCNKELHNL
jgi:hypothetical protein